MELNEMKEFIPTEGSYEFEAWETFIGKMFKFRTGNRVSILTLAEGDFELKLLGKVEVSTDKECWEIVLKFNKIGLVVSKLIEAAYKNGKEEAKEELRDWLKC